MKHKRKPKLVPLTRNQFAIVDAEDYPSVMEHKWYADKGRYKNGKYRAQRTEKRHTIFLHHFIMGDPPEGYVTDHINGNPLDERKSNLRFCTRQQNIWNQSKKSGKHIRQSKYKGVTKGRFKEKTQQQMWKAYIGCGGKVTYLGTFLTEKEAAKAYDAKALKLFGEFARINFPKK